MDEDNPIRVEIKLTGDERRLVRVYGDRLSHLLASAAISCRATRYDQMIAEIIEEFHEYEHLGWSDPCWDGHAEAVADLIGAARRIRAGWDARDADSDARHRGT